MWVWWKSVCVYVYQSCCKNLTASSIIQRSFWVYLVCSAQFPRLCASAGPWLWEDETCFLSSFIVLSLSLTLSTLSISCFHLFTFFIFFKSSDLCLAKWAVLHCWRIRSQQHVDQVNHNADVPALYNSGSQKIIIFIMFNLSMISLISISNVWTKKCPKKNFWCPFYFLVLFNRHTETFRYLVYGLHGPRLTADINIWEASTTDNLL